MTAKMKTGVTYWPGGGVKSDWDRRWNTQSPPYHSALFYSFQRREAISGFVFNQSVPGQVYEPVPESNSYPSYDNCYSEAYSKLQGQIGDQSSWGTNLFEAGEAVGTIEQRGMQLARVANKLKKGDISGAWKSVTQSSDGISHAMPPSWRSKSKNFSDQWLEAHFFWGPTANDIHSALNTLTQTDFGMKKVTANANDSSQRKFNNAGTDHAYSYRTTVKLGLTFRISNESTFLANQVGLLNPLSVAWDLVPYSFVVDWFTNVGTVLSSMTGFVGITGVSQYTTIAQEQFHTASFKSTDGKYVQNGVFHNFNVTRQPAIVGPSFAVKPFKGFSPIRGLTAISLLLQGLR